MLSNCSPPLSLSLSHTHTQLHTTHHWHQTDRQRKRENQTDRQNKREPDRQTNLVNFPRETGVHCQATVSSLSLSLLSLSQLHTTHHWHQTDREKERVRQTDQPGKSPKRDGKERVRQTDQSGKSPQERRGRESQTDNLENLHRETGVHCEATVLPPSLSLSHTHTPTELHTPLTTGTRQTERVRQIEKESQTDRPTWKISQERVERVRQTNLENLPRETGKRESDRQKKRESDRQTNLENLPKETGKRQTDRKRESQTDRPTWKISLERLERESQTDRKRGESGRQANLENHPGETGVQCEATVPFSLTVTATQSTPVSGHAIT